MREINPLREVEFILYFPIFYLRGKEKQYKMSSNPIFTPVQTTEATIKGQDI